MITINGKKFSGSCISINGTTIEISGGNSIRIDSFKEKEIHIHGNVEGNVDGTNITVHGDVKGDLDGVNVTVNGSSGGSIDGVNVNVRH